MTNSPAPAPDPPTTVDERLRAAHAAAGEAVRRRIETDRTAG
ncbi:hypothetical protein ACFV0R_25725 [Streptomyces sp. NPDC059578]